MDIAIVTGASSSLGLAISRRLIQLGFRVYGLGGDYKDCPLQNVNFKPMPCDLADPAALDAACQRILEKEKGVYVLVNNAKFFGRNRYLEMDIPEMERILRINLLCPLVLIQNLAHSLKSLQGYIIQLGALHAESAAGGAAGAAASGGLKWMGDVLFHDLRDYGVKVCQLSPEPNRGRDPRTTARQGARTEASIDPEAVAQAVEQILQTPFGNVVTEMVIRPLRLREVEQEPVRRLPYPEPKPIPFTVPRELIEAEEQLDEEERQEKIERKRERRKARRADEPDHPGPAGEAEAEPDELAEPPAGREQEAPPEQPRSPEQPGQPAAPARHGRRSRRKPKPARQEVGFLPRDKPPAPAGESRQSIESRESKKSNESIDSIESRESRESTKSRESIESIESKAARKRPRRSPRKRAAKKAPREGESGKETA